MALIRFAVDETFHVVWAVRCGGKVVYLHAIGEGAAGNRVTSEFAEQRFRKSQFRGPWVPILFGRRAITTGTKSRNCWAAFLRAARRGCIYF